MIVTDKYILLRNKSQIRLVRDYLDNAIDTDVKWITASNYDGNYKPYFINKKGMFLPPQLIDFVIKLFKANKFQINIDNTLDEFELEPQLPNYPFELYQYQKEIINTILKSDYDGTNVPRKYGIVDFDTNAGKTEVIAAIANTFNFYNKYEPDTKCLIVSYDGQGAMQTQKRLFEYGLQTTRITEVTNRHEPFIKVEQIDMPSSYVNINSELDMLLLARTIILTIDQFKTLASRFQEKKWLTLMKFQTLLWDEPDKITYKTVEAFKYIQKNVNYFEYCFGFTGTYNLNNTVRKIMVSQVVGTPYKKTIKYSELKDKGQSANVVVRYIKIPNFDYVLNSHIRAMHTYIADKNYLVNNFTNYNAVPEATKKKQQNNMYKFLRYLTCIKSINTRKLFLKYWVKVNELDTFKLEQDIIAYHEKIVNTILSFVLEEYVKAYREDNTVGLLINCVNEIKAIDLVTKLTDNYLKRNRVKGCIVKAGHSKNDKELSDLKDDFQNKKINILVTASVKHGLSHNNLFGIVSYVGKGSDKLRQFLGRAERMNSKNKVFVFDINLDNYNLKSLKKHELSRFNLYKQIGYTIMKK